MDVIKNLETLINKGQDSALLRYSLGNEYVKVKNLAAAVAHLARAVELDPGYSAAWKLYGRALAENGQVENAIKVYDQGITVAEKKGDIQAAKEMKVFLKRLRK
ncbi:MAG: tetratricopeptide repeat protein [Gammaproteobacteria bacterium]